MDNATDYYRDIDVMAEPTTDQATWYIRHLQEMWRQGLLDLEEVEKRLAQIGYGLDMDRFVSSVQRHWAATNQERGGSSTRPLRH